MQSSIGLPSKETSTFRKKKSRTMSKIEAISPRPLVSEGQSASSNTQRYTTSYRYENVADNKIIKINKKSARNYKSTDFDLMNYKLVSTAKSDFYKPENNDPYKFEKNFANQLSHTNSNSKISNSSDFYTPPNAHENTKVEIKGCNTIEPANTSAEDQVLNPVMFAKMPRNAESQAQNQKSSIEPIKIQQKNSRKKSTKKKKIDSKTNSNNSARNYKSCSRFYNL